MTFNIPDDLASQIAAAGKDPCRTALEAFAIEEYRSGGLSEGQIREMLGFDTRMEVHSLLANHGVALHYTPNDLDVDAETSSFIRSLHADELVQRP